MATETIFKSFTLDERASKKFIKANPIEVRKSTLLNDINLSKSERIANAAKILRSRKCK